MVVLGLTALETVFQSTSGCLPEKEKKRIDGSKNIQTTPTLTHRKLSRPLPTHYPNQQDVPALEANPALSHHPTKKRQQSGAEYNDYWQYIPDFCYRNQANSKTIKRSEKSNMKKIQISSSKCILSRITRNP